MRKCANINHMKRPLVMYEFATDPIWISLHMRKNLFYFLCGLQTQFLSWSYNHAILQGFTGIDQPYEKPTNPEVSTFLITFQNFVAIIWNTSEAILDVIAEETSVFIMPISFFYYNFYLIYYKAYCHYEAKCFTLHWDKCIIVQEFNKYR